LRMVVTHRRLLQWTPAAQAAFGPQPSLAQYYRRMSGAPVIGAAAVVIAGALGQGAWPLAAVFALAWFASPAVACWASGSPRARSRTLLADVDARRLRLIARRTWRFFEAFVTPAEQSLPPDNFQETPQPIIAHRTSPTNIGLYVLSVVCARDFGWIGQAEAADRLEATFATMARMATHRGHFYNWYDTRDLRPLEPQYISSVDSGNLAGHLLTTANAARQWRAAPLGHAGKLVGVTDALDLAREEAARLREVHKSQSVTWRRLENELDTLAASLAAAEGAEGPDERWDPLERQAGLIIDAAGEIAVEVGDPASGDLLFWTGAVRASIASHRRDLDAPLSSGLEERLALIRTAMTCSPPRRGWRASWPSPRATLRLATGSG